MLSFFGRGSAFADVHNSAFFTEDNDLILLDCPATAFQMVKHFDFSRYEHIYVLVTHTHGDHTGGIGTFLQYLYFAVHKQLTIVVPCQAVYDDMEILLKRIEGCEEAWFQMVLADTLAKPWFLRAVLTQHAQTLDGKCFGYILQVDSVQTIYTGDTHTLEPFEPYLSAGCTLYTELSLYQTAVHLYYKDYLPKLQAYTAQGIRVFLMHLDDESEMQKIIQGTTLQLAPLYDTN